MGEVSIQEAATRLGVSVETIRRRVHKGVVKARQVTTPQGFVWMVELPSEESQREAPSGESEQPHELVAVLIAQLERKDHQLEIQVAAHQEQLEAKDRQIEQLHVLLQQAQAALPAPKADRSWWYKLCHRNGK
jgi:DeoR/GlpR family transcriptional regulator of sugar metabolism